MRRRPWGGIAIAMELLEGALGRRALLREQFDEYPYPPATPPAVAIEMKAVDPQGLAALERDGAANGTTVASKNLLC